MNWLATVLQWKLVTLHSRLVIPGCEVFITVFMYLLGLVNCKSKLACFSGILAQFNQCNQLIS